MLLAVVLHCLLFALLPLAALVVCAAVFVPVVVALTAAVVVSVAWHCVLHLVGGTSWTSSPPVSGAPVVVLSLLHTDAFLL